jgi:hypothetical protein
MERGPVDSWKVDFKVAIERILLTDTEHDAIDIAECHSFDDNLATCDILQHAQLLQPELLGNIQVDKTTTPNELFVEIASILSTGQQQSGDDCEEEEDQEEEEEEEEGEEVEPEVLPTKLTKRKFVPNNDDPVELDDQLLHQMLRKRIRSLKPVKSLLQDHDLARQHLDKLFVLEKDDTATIDDIQPVMHVLNGNYKKWPEAYRTAFLKLKGIIKEF